MCGDLPRLPHLRHGPAASGGFTVFAILKQLERFDLAALGQDSPVAWHLIAESERLAYADRDKYLADADFVRVPRRRADGPRLSRQPLGADLADQRRSPSRGRRARRRRRSPARRLRAARERHVALRRGRPLGQCRVSYTSTIESSFGSGLMVNGYYLNNELTDFGFVPAKDGARSPTGSRGASGRAARWRRPSSTAPTGTWLAVGAAGGSTIPAQVAKAIIGVIDWRLSRAGRRSRCR